MNIFLVSAVILIGFGKGIHSTELSKRFLFFWPLYFFISVGILSDFAGGIYNYNSLLFYVSFTLSQLMYLLFYKIFKSEKNYFTSYIKKMFNREIEINKVKYRQQNFQRKVISKPAKIIYGIIIPLILFVIILAILREEIWILWITILIIVLKFELKVFAPEEKILSRINEILKIKESIKIIFPWLIRVFIVIIILSTITIAIGFIISSIEIPPDQIAIIDSESRNLFIDKIGRASCRERV